MSAGRNDGIPVEVGAEVGMDEDGSMAMLVGINCVVNELVPVGTIDVGPVGVDGVWLALTTDAVGEEFTDVSGSGDVGSVDSLTLVPALPERLVPEGLTPELVALPLAWGLLSALVPDADKPVEPMPEDPCNG